MDNRNQTIFLYDLFDALTEDYDTAMENGDTRLAACINEKIEEVAKELEELDRVQRNLWYWGL